MTHKFNRSLYSGCRSGEVRDVLDILDDEDKKAEKIDLLEDEGIYFYLAANNDHKKVLELLFEYYKKWNLDDKENGSDEYYKAQENLRNTIQSNVVNRLFEENHKEIFELIYKHIPRDDDTDDELELDGLPDSDEHHVVLKEQPNRSSDISTDSRSSGYEGHDLLNNSGGHEDLLGNDTSCI